jgi:uncharacterized membrane protein
MKNSKILKETFILLITIAPMIYLYSIWSSLPETVAIHFDINGKPDNFANKNSLSTTMPLIIGLIYFMFLIIPYIDPTNNLKLFKSNYNKIRLTITILYSVIAFIIINSFKDSQINPNTIFIAVGLLIALMGNYMKSVKHNYYIGIKTPWTLNDQNNWRATHKFASIIWFIGGSCVIALSLIFPHELISKINVALFISIGFIPVIYSFIYFIKNKSKQVQ